MKRRAHRRLVAIALFAAISLLPAIAPATIEEQRQRLPPPAECDDLVAGVWKSHQYDPRYGDWTVFTLHVRRVAGSEHELVGTIVNHSWDAGPAQQEPPPCSGAGSQWIVSMDARGRIHADGRIEFGGIGSWRLDQVICQSGPYAYNLDNFSGVIDTDLNEFQSVNNDGGRSINDPTLFRRISCLEAPPAPHVQPVPPPFYPDMDTGGCGR